MNALKISLICPIKIKKSYVYLYFMDMCYFCNIIQILLNFIVFMGFFGVFISNFQMNINVLNIAT